MPQEGMQTKVWGPLGWGFIYCSIMGYPEQIDLNKKDCRDRKSGMKHFLKNLQYTLPCNLCRDSYKVFYKEMVKKHPHYLDSREKLLRFMYDIHNKINGKLDVSDIPPFDKVQHFYDQFRASCSKTGCEIAAKNKHKINCQITYHQIEANENAPECILSLSENKKNNDDFEGDDFEGDEFEGDDFEGDDFEGDDFEGDEFEGDEFEPDCVRYISQLTRLNPSDGYQRFYEFSKKDRQHIQSFIKKIGYEMKFDSKKLYIINE